MPFSDEERALLMRAPQIGPAVIERLQDVGLDSLARLRQAGADLAVSRVCQHMGNAAWSNRRRALRRALSALAAGPEPR